MARLLRRETTCFAVVYLGSIPGQGKIMNVPNSDLKYSNESKLSTFMSSIARSKMDAQILNTIIFYMYVSHQYILQFDVDHIFIHI